MIFFPEISDEQNQHLLQHSKKTVYKKKSFIYEAGQTPKSVFWIESGLVGLTVFSEKGAEHLLRLFKKGEYFGHRSLLSQENYHAHSTTIEESVIFEISGELFTQLLLENPELAKSVMKKLSIELRMAEIARVKVSEKDVICRVADALVYLMEVYPEHSFTRQEISQFVGTTTPTAIRALGRLEENGLIFQKGRKIEFRDREKLLMLKKMDLE